MPWNSIPTVADTDVLDENDLALYLENLEYLHTTLTDSYYAPAGAADYTKTGTTWGAISADFQLSLTTNGERVLVAASLVSGMAQFDINVDGTRLGNTPATTGDGSWGSTMTSSDKWVYPFMTILNLSAGAHTFDLEWKANAAATARIYGSYKPWFMVRALKL
jgi:hypothetical protein